MTYSYSSNLPQVQSVREVTFRDYAIDTSSKWHHRGNLSHCYSSEEMVHRDCLSGSNTLGEMFAKNSSVGFHSSSNSTSNFYGSVGRNGVLPQAFDQFFRDSLRQLRKSISGLPGGQKYHEVAHHRNLGL
ncbi:hypothetical protein GJAV_G00016220 [Gymnothorax javanicus]|nr:hypothetical protein GJAV_G00016220 [Gymnothorax javanicus]